MYAKSRACLFVIPRTLYPGKPFLQPHIGGTETRRWDMRLQVLEQVRAFKRQEEERDAAVARFAASNEAVATFPPGPRIPEYAGPGAEDWVASYTSNVIEI